MSKHMKHQKCTLIKFINYILSAYHCPHQTLAEKADLMNWKEQGEYM